MTFISRVEIERFASEIAGRLGLAVEGRTAGISAVLQDRLRESASASVTEYLARITPAEVSALAERLTVGETYFFRYREQFDALRAALPTLVARRGSDRPLRILSAACSSGEEPGTIAIVLRSSLSHEIACASTIVAIDVNPAAIRRARRGRYSEWSLRETPEPLRSRWFHVKGHEYELDEAARRLVTFAEKNLSALDDELFRPEAYDVVFCRNALMYFTEDAAHAVISRIARSLAPGGLLFLGPTETHLGSVPGLAVRQSHGTFYHERADESGPVTFARRDPTVQPAAVEAPEVAAPGLDDRWADQILAAAERIAAMAPRVSSSSASAAPTALPSLGTAEPESAIGPDLARAMELLREERIADALRVLPPEGHSNPEVHVLRGVLLAGLGDLPGAEQACRAALALDPLHAGARYLLALCCEHAGDEASAIEHDRAAIYLEPRFAMPHMHLGLLARRRGDLVEASRELRLAAALLAEDDGARVLLLGGGLRRDALIDLCRAELRACGGVS